MTRKMLLAAGAAALLSSASAAAGGPVPPGVAMPRGADRSDEMGDAERRSGGLLNEWRMKRDWSYSSWQGIANSYAAALRFVECAARAKPASLALIQRPIGVPGDREALVRLVRQNPGCVSSPSAISPVLFRAALAETALNDGASLPPPGTSVGLPDTVEGYPLAAVSRCLVGRDPEGVARVLRTRPGDEAEGVATSELFSRARDCVPPTNVVISPTAARLALVDAVYRRYSR